MGSLALRPGDSLTTLKMALSVGFRSVGFPPVCNSSYRAPDSCPGGTDSRWMRQPSAGRTVMYSIAETQGPPWAGCGRPRGSLPNPDEDCRNRVSGVA